ncbi:RAS protein activator like-3 isoform X2 [Aphelocoma coerulescens]|uniref:RAS protein activator like-3 isoform X2 n=1 Tax=Aphelocoma coerulescens TaxID=39617 RepID=UPI0036045C36
MVTCPSSWYLCWHLQVSPGVTTPLVAPPWSPVPHPGTPGGTSRCPLALPHPWCPLHGHLSLILALLVAPPGVPWHCHTPGVPSMVTCPSPWHPWCPLHGRLSPILAPLVAPPGVPWCHHTPGVPSMVTCPSSWHPGGTSRCPLALPHPWCPLHGHLSLPLAPLVAPPGVPWHCHTPGGTSMVTCPSSWHCWWHLQVSPGVTTPLVAPPWSPVPHPGTAGGTSRCPLALPHPWCPLHGHLSLILAPLVAPPWSPVPHPGTPGGTSRCPLALPHPWCPLHGHLSLILAPRVAPPWSPVPHPGTPGGTSRCPLALPHPWCPLHGHLSLILALLVAPPGVPWHCHTPGVPSMVTCPSPWHPWCPLHGHLSPILAPLVAPPGVPWHCHTPGVPSMVTCPPPWHPWWHCQATRPLLSVPHHPWVAGTRWAPTPCSVPSVTPAGTSPLPVAPVPPDATVWDVSQFSLVDGHLVPLGRDEEGSWWSRTRATSATSEATNLYPAGRRDPDPDERNPRGVARNPENETPPSSQFSNVKGLLWKRLLRDRKSRGGTKSDAVAAVPEGDRVPSRSASRESLVPPAELDLTGDNVIVRPVHGSVVGERFCFQDNCERLELALTLWVYEGRDLPPRRRLRCHLQLDGAIFARTTAKAAGADGQLFWGELFQLAALPPARALTVALCRDDQPGTPVAAVTIPLAELAAARQPLERWYSLSGGGGGERAPAVRLRGRYREVRVLPIVRYKELAEFITFHYRELCGHLEPAIAARHKEELAGALVRVLQSTGKAKSFLIDLGVAELDRFDDHEALIFRENTLATKAIDEYMKLVGAKYLQDTLGEVVARLCSSEESFEVDPSKCSGLELSEHRQHLRQVCEETLQRITDGSESFPAELGEVFAAWRDECAARGKVAIGQRLVSASLFLRFLCPAIMSPSLFGLVQEYPSEATARTLTLVAKVIQNLANFTTFGEKEPYMTFMNEFLEQNLATMTEFLGAVATPEASAHMATYDGYVDLALELATLHLLLCDIFASLDQATQEELEPLPTILRAIREGTPVPVSVRLSSTARRSPSEPPKPGFVPPRDLGKHSPLIKSQSLTSVRRVRGRDEGKGTGTEPEPSPEPSPIPVPTPVPARQRRNVQRTQSVPAQGKAARRPAKPDSAGHADEAPPEDGTGSPVPGDGPPRGKLRSSASLPRKPAVPWQRLAEDPVAPGELYALRPLEKHGRLLEALREELAEHRERLERAEARAARAEEQHRELLERLRAQLDESNARAANLAARLTAAEGSRKKDLERLKTSEEQGRELERRLSGLQRELSELRGALARARGHPRGVPVSPPRDRDEPGADDAQATSV